MERKAVERVARAVQGKLDDEFAERGGLSAEDMADMAARSAIAEVMAILGEPTEAMLVAGLKEGDILGELIDWRGPDSATRDDVARILAAALSASPLSQGGQDGA